METKTDYLNNLCEIFQKDIETRKSIQEEGGKPEGIRSLVINHVTLNVSENSKLQFTNNYEQCATEPLRLIVRRGWAFTIAIQFDRQYEEKKDLILVELTFGSNPTFQQGTRKILRVEPSNDNSDRPSGRWAAKITDAHENDLHVRINTSTNTPIGEWKLKLQTGNITKARDVNAYTSFICPDYFYIIFNPWCQEDTVYMADEKQLKEYVLNEQGSLWQGAKRGHFEPCPWNFGQFEDASLYTALIVLRMSDISDVERKDAVLTVRKLTEAVNRYILAGRWQEPFDDGTKPWEWTGSVEIMEKFVKTLKHVKYGQCWVFSGVLVTLCRALGIPCRSVTNISSAHDTDRTLTIDDIYIKRPTSSNFKKTSNDSVWNFHVWNEVWMQRPDLPPGYDGWQVCDATPQELSQGRYQCGPMSLVALRQAKVQYDFDGWFIYGEVNADVVSWYYLADLNAPNGLKLLRVDTDTKGVGTCIVTTDLNNPHKPFELTSQYKPAEGTDEEREQFRNAIRTVVAKDRAEILKLYDCDKKKIDDVTFDMNDIDVVPFGKKVSSLLTISNYSNTVRTVVVTMEMYVVRYDGVKQTKVAEYEEKIGIEDNQLAKVKLESHVNSYGMKLKEHSHMCVEAVAHVLETNQIYSNRDSFMIQKTSLEITGSRRVRVNQPTELSILFNNPCSYPLTNCQMKVEGSGLGKIFKAEIAKQIRAREELRIVYTVIPRRPGKKVLVAVFTSDQLTNIRGTFTVEVE